MACTLRCEKKDCVIVLDKKDDVLIGNMSNNKPPAIKYYNAKKTVHKYTVKDRHADKLKLKYVSSDEELTIFIRIEKARKELCKMVSYSNKLHDDEIVEMSQYLDKLLADYIDIKEGRNRNMRYELQA